MKLKCARYMKALGDDTRVGILRLLLRRPQFVSDLAKKIGASVATTSYHLHVMRNAGLLVEERQGLKVRYGVSPEILKAANDELLDFGCCKLAFPRRRTASR